MNNHSYELFKNNNVATIKEVENWLDEVKNHVNFLISESPCRKWDKWKNNNEKPFPCVCAVRNDECIFIELYYKFKELEGTYQLTKKLKADETDIILLKKLENHQSIRIVTCVEPYQTIKFKIHI